MPLPFSQSRRKFSTTLILAAVSLASIVLAAGNDAQHYLNDVKTLSAPSMEGRGDGTKGLARAAHLIERRFQQLGLEPGGTESYFQPFTLISGAELKGDNHFQIGGTGLKLNRDFVPFSFSASGPATGRLVFAGYGVSAREFGYDDYDGLDVKDRIVVLLRHEPPDFAVKTGNHGMTQHAQLITKAINARNHGAKAVALINGKLGDGEEDWLTRFGSVSGPVNSGIILVQVKNEVAEKWFRDSGKSFQEIQNQIDNSSKPASFAFPESLHISINVNVESTKAVVNNVLAYLPGETDEYVIVGAHYDHLGRGHFDSLAPSQIGQIHPGADDNASGTAGVLELAGRFASLKGRLRLRRGILFMTFAGEELGLLGSEAWVEHPTKPLDKAIAMVNMDMIGRIRDDKVYIGGVGTGSTFQAILDQAEKESKSHFKIEYSPGGPSSSDHTSFVTKRVPALFFFSGLHSDYHKPSDTWEKINSPSAVRLLDMVEDVSRDLANASDRPGFTAVVENKPAGGVGGGGYGPYFGSIPDFGQVDNGVKFSDVKAGSPAAKAGLKAGDVLIQFGDKPIKNLYDFTDALRRSKVGDVVEVKVLRGQETITANVKLEQRR